LDFASKFKNILIFGHNNLGDVCYDLIVVSCLRKEFPRAKISFIVGLQCVELVELCKGVNQAITFDKQKGFLNYWYFIRRIKAKHFDLSIILRNTQMHYFFAISKQIKSKRYFFKKNNLHNAEKNLALLSKIGIKQTSSKLNFSFSKQDIAFAAKLIINTNRGKTNLLVGIMPFAGWTLKCWPVERWNQLIALIDLQLDAKVFVFGKTGKNLWEEKFVRDISDKSISLINKCSLSRCLSVIKNMDLFIGTDSSLLHFASSLGVPAVGLYGPTDANIFYPFYHRKYRVIANNRLKCMPCYLKARVGSCGVKAMPAECMKRIEAWQVMEKVNQIIKEEQIWTKKKLKTQ